MSVIARIEPEIFVNPRPQCHASQSACQGFYSHLAFQMRRFASLNKLSAPDSPPKDIGLGLVGGSKSLSGARNPYPRAARAAARAARASTRANACAQKQKQNDWETSGSERSWHEVDPSCLTR